MKRWVERLIPVWLCVMLLFFAWSWLLRDFWFDEALTVMNFALLPSAGEIYRNYVIPNNQIVYTWILHFWIPLQPETIAFDLWVRIPSLLAGFGVLILLFRTFRNRFGGWNMLVVLTALGVSPPFLLYATAVRGYMTGAFFVVLTLFFAMNFAVFGKARDGFGYFVGAFLALGTIPSNLAALAGVGLFALPCCGAGWGRRPRFWVLLFAPFAAGALFYAPIARHFLGVARLGEGWRDHFGVLQALAAALLGTFGMLLLPGAAACGAFLRKNFNWMRSTRAMIWLIPIPAALLLPVAPFPRVFFPLFPLFALLLAAGLCDLSARNCRLRRRWNRYCWYGGLLVMVVCWGSFFQTPSLRTEFSMRCGGAGRDDFFLPYYLRPGYSPLNVARKLTDVKPEYLYLSFSADPWPLMFYSRLLGVEAKDFLFDGPRGRVPFLPSGTAVILNRGESPSSVIERFGGKLEPLFAEGMHTVWSWKP